MSPALARTGATPATHFTLGVSGVRVGLRPPSGQEDVMLAEGLASDPAVALALIERLALSDPAIVWRTLPAPDADAIIVRMRQAQLGDRVAADIFCRNAACRGRIDVSFGLDAYLEHHRPKKRARGRGWRVSVDGTDGGRFVLEAKSGEIRFRLPSIGDVVDASSASTPALELERRCVPALAPGAPIARAVESAMRSLAPPLAGPIEGRCPECGAAFEVDFEARAYCMSEMRDRARFVFEDVDAIASRYHWSEEAILALPGERRRTYAELARQARPA